MEKKLSLLMLAFFVLSIPSAFFFPDFILNTKFIGEFFIYILKLFVPFIIFISISYSIASFSSENNLGKMIPLTLILYILSTTFAIVFSLLISSNINFPKNNDLIAELNFSSYVKKGLSESLSPLGFDITNIHISFIEGNPLSIMIIAIFIGLIVRLIKNKQLIRFLEISNTLILKLITYIMWIAPLAIFSLFGSLLINVDFKIIILLFKFVLISITIFIGYFFILHGLIIKYLLKERFLVFINNIKDTLFFAFVSSSSSATIPFSLKTANEKLKIRKQVSNFVIPIGATVNMDGSAIYLGLSAVFISSIIGMDLTIVEYSLILLTATIGSIGAAGVPSIALVMMTVVFTSIGIPIEAISILAGVDRILDMFRTSLNVGGDLLITKIVNKFT